MAGGPYCYVIYPLLVLCFTNTRYLMATFLSMYNKWMFSAKHLGFHFPLLVTGVHQLEQWILSTVVLLAVPAIRPKKQISARHYL